MKFDNRYFAKKDFTENQVSGYIENAKRDLNIAKKDKFLDVKFNYTYKALFKSGIALLGHYRRKVKNVRGHHVKVIDKLAEILEDNDISAMGNLMRSKRNTDLYDGGVMVTSKECKEYLAFTEKIVDRVSKIIATGE